MLDEQNSVVLKVIIKGTEVPGAIIDGELGMNVISKKICDELDIQDGRCAHSGSGWPTRAQSDWLV